MDFLIVSVHFFYSATFAVLIENFNRNLLQNKYDKSHCQDYLQFEILRYIRTNNSGNIIRCFFELNA